MTLAVSALGRRLQLVHATRWVHGANGDPYAQLLRGFDDAPQPAHEEARRRGPLWHSRAGAWVTAHHRVAADLAGHPALAERAPDGYCVPDGVLPDDQAAPLVGHTEAERLRAATAAVLGTGAAAAHRHAAAAACTRLLDGAGARLDLAADIAARLPIEALADLYGLTGARRDRFTAACHAAATALDSLQCPQRLDDTRRTHTALADLGDLLAEHAATGRPGDTLTALTDAAGPAPALRLPVAFTVLAQRTTATLIANAALAALDRPGEWTRLADDPGHPARVVTETLRHDPPVSVQAMTARADLTAAGTRIRAGDRVAVLIGAANRDPAAFPDPARFDPDRPPAPVLVPGLLHRLAAPLARTQAET
ncbi:cytochrome P450 family protein, partial [Marinitenerispora sediminis]|uniref:cytochrome P450 family protein n=2 Tax=Marinitenerispora sediminis TaxID=1931232 RepID=UPI000DF20C0A